MILEASGRNAEAVENKKRSNTRMRMRDQLSKEEKSTWVGRWGTLVVLSTSRPETVREAHSAPGGDEWPARIYSGWGRRMQRRIGDKRAHSGGPMGSSKAGAKSSKLIGPTEDHEPATGPVPCENRRPADDPGGAGAPPLRLGSSPKLASRLAGAAGANQGNDGENVEGDSCGKTR